jgi:hypothetical protein
MRLAQARKEINLAYDSGLDDDALNGMAQQASPYWGMGLDPDDPSDRAGAMAKLMQDPEQRMLAQTAQTKGSMGTGAAPDAGAQSQVAPSTNPTIPRGAAATAPAAVTPAGSTNTDPNADMRTQLQNIGLTAAQKSLAAAQQTGDLANPSAEETAASGKLAADRSGIAADTAAVGQTGYGPDGKVLPQYKPTTWQKIQRGLADLRQGGIIGAIAPGASGLTPYGAPNSQYDRDHATAVAKLGSDTAQQAQDDARFKQLTDARKAQAQTLKDQTGLYNASGKTASEQLTAMNTDELNTAKAQLDDYKEKGKLPQTLEAMVLASKTEPDPVKRQQYADAVGELQKIEVKKYQYNPAATEAAAARADAAKARVQDKLDKNEDTANGLIEQHLTAKQAYESKMKRSADGRTYVDMSSGNLPISAADYAANVEKFRGDLNGKLGRLGYSMGADGKIAANNHAKAPGGGGAAPASTGGVIYAKAPDGRIHSAPAGSAIPKGWTQAKGPKG